MDEVSDPGCETPGGRILRRTYEAADLAAEEDGPQAYAPMLAEDIRGMEELREAGTYQEIAECLRS